MTKLERHLSHRTNLQKSFRDWYFLSLANLCHGFNVCQPGPSPFFSNIQAINIAEPVVNKRLDLTRPITYPVPLLRLGFSEKGHGTLNFDVPRHKNPPWILISFFIWPSQTLSYLTSQNYSKLECYTGVQAHPTLWQLIFWCSGVWQIRNWPGGVNTTFIPVPPITQPRPRGVVPITRNVSEIWVFRPVPFDVWSSWLWLQGRSRIVESCWILNGDLNLVLALIHGILG